MVRMCIYQINIPRPPSLLESDMLTLSFLIRGLGCRVCGSKDIGMVVSTDLVEVLDQGWVCQGHTFDLSLLSVFAELAGFWGSVG